MDNLYILGNPAPKVKISLIFPFISARRAPTAVKR